MGALPVNGERGEVALRIGTVDLVIAAEIGRLAALSTALKCMSLAELYARLFGAEVTAISEGIRCLTVRGEAEEALAKLTLADFPAAKAAFEAALLHHITVAESNGKRHKSSEDMEGLPFLRWFKAAIAVFGWRPAAFWRSTVTEFSQTAEGYRAINSRDASDTAPTQKEMSELLKRYGA